MSTRFDRLATADLGAILAEIPGALGFYPTESLVIIGLNIEEDAVGIEPIVRADLDAERLKASAARLLHALQTDTYIALVITRDTTTDMFADMSALGLAPLVTVTAPSVETDEQYTLLSANVPELGRAWAAGRVAPVFAAQSMRQRIARGEVIAVDRNEAFGKFDMNEDIVPPLTLVDLRSRADQLIYNLRATDPGEPRNAIYREYNRGWRSCNDEALLVFSLAACHPGEPTLRDLLMADACANPERYRETLLTVARISHGEARANALCLYALSAEDSDGMLAVDAAYEADPNHSLTRLLQQIRLVKPLHEVALPSALAAVRKSIV